MTLTKELMLDYACREREIKRLEEKIEYFASYVTPSEHGVVMGSMKDFPFARCHFVLSGSNVRSDDERQEKLKNLLITLQEKREYFFDVEIEVSKAIEEVENSEMREILEDYYVKGMTQQEIADKLGYTKSAITKKMTRFFEE